MTDYVPNLEDFLQWEDADEVTTEKDPFEGNGKEEVVLEDKESQEQPDSNNEEATETEDNVVTPEPNSEAEESSEDNVESTQVDVVFDIMNKAGILELPEDFKFDGSVEKLVEALEITEQNRQLQMAQNLWEKLPEDFRAVLEYGLAGGTDLSVVQGVVNNQINLDKLNIEDEKDQKTIVKTYLEKTTKLTPEKINKRIKMLYDSDLLEDEANESLNELKAIQVEERKKLVQDELDRKALEQEELNKAYTVFTDIASKLDVPDKRKQDIVKAVWESSKSYDGKTPMSYVEHIDNQIRNNPEHFAQLVNIYLDYDPKVGFKEVGKSTRKATTAAAKNLRDTLQDILNGNNVVKAVSNPKKDSSGFDFEQFIKYS